MYVNAFQRKTGNKLFGILVSKSSMSSHKAVKPDTKLLILSCVTKQKSSFHGVSHLPSGSSENLTLYL